MHFHSAYILLARSTYIIRQHIGGKNRAGSARAESDCSRNRGAANPVVTYICWKSKLCQQALS